MYIAIKALLVALAAYLLVRGVRGRRVNTIVAGAAVLAGTFLAFALLDLWGDYLWFAQLGFSGRFWTVTVTQWLLAVVVALLAAGALWLLTMPAPRRAWPLRASAAGLAAAMGGAWGHTHWDTWLRWLNRVDVGRREPVHDLDVGFYLFTLPLLDALVTLAVLVCAIALVLGLLGANLRVRDGQLERREGDDLARDPLTPLWPAAGVLLLTLAAGRWLERYHLLGSDWGAVHGAGWTDVHVRLPGYALTAAVAVVLGVLVLAPAGRRWLNRRATRWVDHDRADCAMPLLAAGASLAVVWILTLGLVPRAVQWLRVEPNEISLERPYIARNIEFTREAFGLTDVEEHAFPAREQFAEAMVDSNPSIFENIRLWDWRALDAVYKQFQEIRLYYEFNDIDIDRYQLGGRLRQVMVSAREMEHDNLPAQSRTFVNRHFKYTHGYGMTMAKVNEFTSEGLPELIIRDIPPAVSLPGLAIDRPEVYYGELTRDYAVVNTEEKEFDYPQGEDNVYVRYAGEGGVPMTGFWRQFIYGHKFGDTRLLLSGYPREGTRVMFRRQVRERLQAVAPFLTFEDDPYVVLHDGRMFWFLDAYTTSDRYPYSEPFRGEEHGTSGRPYTLEQSTAAALRGANYLRNSVKAVVDAYDGTVSLYVFESDDPLIRVWRAIFPDLFRDRSEMPVGLRDHIRYPSGRLLVQGLVYAKYHMTDPTVFYNQEDLWVRATEKYYGTVQPVEPYYIIWETPEADRPEFILMLPFTPKNRQVLIGWIAGMCDGENYGRYLAYKFPKERRVIGPQQVETKIDQDRHLSGQLTLWDQRGSRVIRGNMLAIPVEGTLIYVEPIYLQAETAAYPELRLVAVMYDDQLSYAETFADALAGLYGEGTEVAGALPGPEASASLAEQIQRAQAAFDEYLAALGARRFAASSEALDALASALSALQGQAADNAATDTVAE